MPRASSPRSAPFRPTRLLPPPSPVVHRPAQPPMVIQPAAPSFAQSIKDGFGVGIGVHVARHVVDSVANTLGNAFQQAPSAPRPFTGETLPPAVPVQTDYEKVYSHCLAVKDAGRCGALTDSERNQWLQCMKESKYEASACSHMFAFVKD